MMTVASPDEKLRTVVSTPTHPGSQWYDFSSGDVWHGGHITPLHEGQQEQPVNDYKCVPTLSPVMQVLTPSQVRRAATLAAARWALGRARRALQQAGYEVEWCHESAVGSKRQRQSAADALESSLRY